MKSCINLLFDFDEKNALRLFKKCVFVRYDIDPGTLNSDCL